MMSGYCGSYEAHVMGACACGVFHGQTHHLYEEEYSDMYSFPPNSSVVDCTLSLGTPSTRLTELNSNRHHDHLHQRRSVSNTNSATTHHSRSTNDSLLARRCANCDTTVTPLWRNGPRGPKSLCNACGIRYKKEEKRASAAAAAATVSASDSSAIYGHHNNYWYAHSQGGGGGGDGDTENGGMSFLSWRLNVST